MYVYILGRDITCTVFENDVIRYMQCKCIQLSTVHTHEIDS